MNLQQKLLRCVFHLTLYDKCTRMSFSLDLNELCSNSIERFLVGVSC